jgi:hypothetical protein
MKTTVFTIFTIGCAFLLFAAAARVTAQTPQLRATNRQVQSLLNQIDSKTQGFQTTIGGNMNGGLSRNEELSDLVQDFASASGTLRSRVDSRQSSGEEVTDMLNKASLVDRFVSANRLSSQAAIQWRGLGTDLNTLASYYRTSWNRNRAYNSVGTPAYTATDTQLGALIARIESKTNSYRRSMDNSLDQSNINNTRSEDSINTYIRNFEDATDRLKQNFNSRRSTAPDASEVLNRARYIDQFMAGSTMNRGAERQWNSLRTDLSTLATYYRLGWNWNDEQPPPYATDPYSPAGSMDKTMSGTYRLNAARSDNVARAIDRSLGNFPTDQRNRLRQNLERRLRSPEMIAIERRGKIVSIASSNSPQVTFEADGIARTETNPRGRTVTTTATANDEGVLIGYEGDRMNDFHVTFAPSGNRQLRVSRRIYLEDTDESITVASVYDKTNNSPQWSTVNNGSSSTTAQGNFYVANGTRIDATLRETVDTRSSKAGDRFTMDVTSPGQYRGAVIEGTVGEVSNSGRLSGRANISLDFETISMNGKTYQFAGLIESVTAANGDTVSVNNEGSVRDSSQTTQTAIRTGIGAVLGTVIGAIAGGGKGAAIGAAVGGGAGAGSVIITGRDSIELGPGSAFRISASAPASVGQIR